MKRRQRVRLLIVVVPLALILAISGYLTWFFASGGLARKIEGAYAERLPGRLEVGGARLASGDRIEVGGVRLVAEEGGPALFSLGRGRLGVDLIGGELRSLELLADGELVLDRERVAFLRRLVDAIGKQELSGTPLALTWSSGRISFADTALPELRIAELSVREDAGVTTIRAALAWPDRPFEVVATVDAAGERSFVLEADLVPVPVADLITALEEFGLIEAPPVGELPPRAALSALEFSRTADRSWQGSAELEFPDGWRGIRGAGLRVDVAADGGKLTAKPRFTAAATTTDPDPAELAASWSADGRIEIAAAGSWSTAAVWDFCGRSGWAPSRPSMVMSLGLVPARLTVDGTRVAFRGDGDLDGAVRLAWEAGHLRCDLERVGGALRGRNLGLVMPPHGEFHGSFAVDLAAPALPGEVRWNDLALTSPLIAAWCGTIAELQEFLPTGGLQWEDLGDRTTWRLRMEGAEGALVGVGFLAPDLLEVSARELPLSLAGVLQLPLEVREGRLAKGECRLAIETADGFALRPTRASALMRDPELAFDGWRVAGGTVAAAYERGEEGELYAVGVGDLPGRLRFAREGDGPWRIALKRFEFGPWQEEIRVVPPAPHATLFAWLGGMEGRIDGEAVLDPAGRGGTVLDVERLQLSGLDDGEHLRDLYADLGGRVVVGPQRIDFDVSGQAFEGWSGWEPRGFDFTRYRPLVDVRGSWEGGRWRLERCRLRAGDFRGRPVPEGFAIHIDGHGSDTIEELSCRVLRTEYELLKETFALELPRGLDCDGQIWALADVRGGDDGRFLVDLLVDPVDADCSLAYGEITIDGAGHTTGGGIRFATIEVRPGADGAVAVSRADDAKAGEGPFAALHFAGRGLHANAVQVLGMLFTDVVGDLSLQDRLLSATNIRARAYGGEVRAHLSVTEDETVQINLAFEDLDIADFIRRVGRTESDFYGRADGDVELVFPKGAVATLHGSGQVRFRDATLASMPGIAKLLIGDPVDGGKDQGSVDFRIDGGMVLLDRIKIDNPSLHLRGSGTIGFDGETDIVLLPNTRPWVFEPVRWIPGVGHGWDAVWGLINESLGPLHIEGHIRDPSVFFRPW